MSSDYIPRGRQADNFFNIGDIDVQIRMAQAENSNLDPDIPRNYKILPDGTTVYSNPESKRIAEMRIASNQGLKEAIGRQPLKYIDTIKSREVPRYDYFNNHVDYNKGRVLNNDNIPLGLKIANRDLGPASVAKAQNAPPLSVQDQADAADQQMATYISESIKNEELASGAEYSADDLTAIINERFPGVNANILNLAINMILNDAEDIKSRVAGTFPNFKLLVSARKPAFGKQTTTTTTSTTPAAVTPQQNQQQPQQQSQPNNNQVQLPPDLQRKIDALSPQDRNTLEQTASSVVKDVLPQISDPVPELDLENSIASKYGVSSAIADLLVEVLKLYPTIAALIIPQDQQPQPQSNNLNNTTNVKSQVATAPTKQPDQQQQQQSQDQQMQQPKTASVANGKDVSWEQLRALIVNTPIN
jgi:hypothetical protein